MNHPQSHAQKFFAGVCLALCYLYCSEREAKTDSEAAGLCLDALGKGLLEDDGTVKSATDLLKFFDGNSYDVQKREIQSLTGIKEPTPVRFDAPGFIPHWVVVADERVAFNPLSRSNSVERGKPTTARIIRRRGK